MYFALSEDFVMIIHRDVRAASDLVRRIPLAFTDSHKIEGVLDDPGAKLRCEVIHKCLICSSLMEMSSLYGNDCCKFTGYKFNIGLTMPLFRALIRAINLPVLSKTLDHIPPGWRSTTPRAAANISAL